MLVASFKETVMCIFPSGPGCFVPIRRPIKFGWHCWAKATGAMPKARFNDATINNQTRIFDLNEEDL